MRIASLYAPATDLPESRPFCFSLPAAAAMVAALLIAVLLNAIQSRLTGQPESVVLTTAAVLGALFFVGAGGAVVRLRREPARAALGVVTTVAILLAGLYLFCVSSAVLFPADFLSWSESDFVNDILKFRAGYPIYTADVNNESFTYPVGTQLLTYFLASLVGKGTSIPAYRVVQLLFTTASAVVAMLCCRRLVALAAPGVQVSRIWPALWLPTLFLVATNPITNTYAHNLHNDALAQLLTVGAYYVLLRYAASPSTWLLAIMAAISALGFLAKQSLVIWVALYGVYLVFFHRPFVLRRVIGFAAGAGALLAVVIGVCFAIWGEPFYYWIFVVLGKHGVSPLRSFQHLLDVWPFLAAGLFGGWAVLRARFDVRLLGLWGVWLALILSQVWTSGVAWMLNHIGPGSLLGGVWLAAGLAIVWTTFTPMRRPTAILDPVLTASLVLLAFAGMGLVRVPLPMVPSEAAHYLAAIEAEFERDDPSRVLIDAGSWMYLPRSVVMKDRAPSIGERGWSQTGDFSGAVERIRTGRYEKILVRNYDSPGFWYDHATWSKSSGIRDALARHYDVETTIAGITGPGGREISYLFGPISVLKSRHSESASPARKE